jgi:hypothetical protein
MKFKLFQLHFIFISKNNLLVKSYIYMSILAGMGFILPNTVHHFCVVN